MNYQEAEETIVAAISEKIQCMLGQALVSDSNIAKTLGMSFRIWSAGATHALLQLLKMMVEECSSDEGRNRLLDTIIRSLNTLRIETPEKQADDLLKDLKKKPE